MTNISKYEAYFASSCINVSYVLYKRITACVNLILDDKLHAVTIFSIKFTKLGYNMTTTFQINPDCHLIIVKDSM